MKSVCTTGIGGFRQLLRCGQNPETRIGFRLGRNCGLRRRCLFGCNRGRIFIEGDSFNRSHEAIATAGQSFNESRIARRVTEGFADAIYRGVYAVLGIDKGSVGPEFPGDFFASKKLAGMAQEHQEHLKRLRVQLDAHTLLAKLTGGGVRFKCSEAITQGWLWVCHV